MFGLSYSSQLIQGSALRTWSCVTHFANLLWYKLHHFGLPIMPRSRRRHHSRSRSRSRSHSYDRDREPKRRRIDGYESPHHRRSLSSEPQDEMTHEEQAEKESGKASPKEVVPESNVKIEQSTKTEEMDIVEENSKVGATAQKDDLASADDEKMEPKEEILKVEDITTEDITSEDANEEEIKANENTDLETTKEDNEEHDESKYVRNDDDVEVKDVDSDEKHDNCDSKVLIPGADMGKLTAKIKEDILKSHMGKPMSPRNLRRKIELELRKEQKRFEKEEKEKKRQELKEEKIKQRHEKEEQRKKELEAKQKEKEVKEERKRKEREERDKKRKEKEEMEEQKRKEREQEKLKKMQEIEEKHKEKQKIEEQKQKTAAAFASFFTKKSDTTADDKKADEAVTSLFMPFEVKSDMRLAPLTRIEIMEEEKGNLMKQLEKQIETKLYLEELKEGKPVGSFDKTWPAEENDSNDDVMIVEETPLGESIVQEHPKSSKMRAKFLKFDENRRPPYHGTWRKKSKRINSRRPFSQDKEFFDYEVDSDDDWEDEEDAGEVESLKGSDEEEKEASDNEYEVDNEFFVPHGHLSDDEMNDEEDKPLSPETHKAHLRLLKNQFEEEMKSKTMKIKPRIIGCIWQNKAKDNVDETLQKFLEPLSVICMGPIKIKERSSIVNQIRVRKVSPPKKKLDREHVPSFLALIHGNVKKRKFIVDEFLEYLKAKEVEVNVSKLSLGKELKQLAEWTRCPEKGPMRNKFCWFVPQSIRNEYQIELSLPNNWKYTLKHS